MKWFKFYGQDFLTDSKLGALHPLQRLMWVALLCVASQDEERTGVIKFLTEDRLMALCGITLEVLEENKVKQYVTLETFCNMGLVTYLDENTLLIVNFQKKQKQQSTSTERVAAWRERNKAISQKPKEMKNETNVTLQSNGRVEKSREDNISDSENRTVNSKDMGWKPHNENDHTDDIPSVDADTGEKIRDRVDEEKEENKKITHNLGILGEARGKRFLDIPTQRSFYKRLLTAGLTHKDIGAQFMDLLESPYWKEKKDQLPDLKSLYSIVKNKT